MLLNGEETLSYIKRMQSNRKNKLASFCFSDHQCAGNLVVFTDLGCTEQQQINKKAYRHGTDLFVG